MTADPDSPSEFPQDIETPSGTFGVTREGNAFVLSRRESAPLRRARKLHQEAIAQAKAGRWKLALEAFRGSVKHAPDQPGFHYGLGVALCHHDRFDEAIAAFRREIEITPDHAPAMAEIGTCLARTGRPADGIPYLEMGLGMMPQMPLAQYSLGLAQLTENKRTEAIAALTRAIDFDGSYADAYRTRGLAYALDGQFERSVDDLHVAAALDSENYKAIIDLGLTFGKAERNQQAGRLLEMAAKISPDIALTQYVYGQFLINQRQFEQGLDYIERAIALDPLHPETYVAKGFGYLGQGRVEEAVTWYRKAGEMKPADATIAGTLLFALQHKPGITKAELLREHRKWGMLYRPGAPRDRFTFANDANPARRPRLGLVSGDMHRHAVAFLTLPAFEQLAAQGYEIVCFKTERAREDDDFSDRFKAAAVAWHEVFDLNDDELAALVAKEKIDILFDLAGHTAGNRLAVFARRAAPIQLTWAGYVGTVGLDTYEGLIADAVEVPPGDDEHYAEPVIRLPDCYVSYQPPTADAPVTPLPCLERGYFTFGCFNRPAKLNQTVTAAWARILARVPDSRILMVYGGLGEPSTQATVKALLEAGGVAVERVEMVGDGQQSKLLEGYGRVDLALDPFPYSGGVTTLEAMWMGVPAVTLVGDTFAGRHSATHLTAAGLGEFCTRSVEDYVALAAGWSKRPQELAELRRGLRDRLSASPLCDAPRFAGNLGAELTRLWRDWCDGRHGRIASGH